MSARAGIIVTGTEVLSGRVSDRNGPWLSGRLLEIGVELAHTAIVADRPGDLRAVLDFMASQELDLVITSGGLGPTADDLTAAVVGEFQGLEMQLDEALEQRIAQIVRPFSSAIPTSTMRPSHTATASRQRFPRAQPFCSRSEPRRVWW